MTRGPTIRASTPAQGPSTTPLPMFTRRLWKSAHALLKEASGIVDGARERLRLARSPSGDKVSVKAAKTELREAKRVRRSATKRRNNATSSNPRTRVPQGRQFLDPN